MLHSISLGQYVFLGLFPCTNRSRTNQPCPNMAEWCLAFPFLQVFEEVRPVDRPQNDLTHFMVYLKPLVTRFLRIYLLDYVQTATDGAGWSPCMKVEVFGLPSLSGKCISVYPSRCPHD